VTEQYCPDDAGSLAQYRAMVDQFADERARVESQLAMARQRGETVRAANLYRYWQQIVARQRRHLDFSDQRRS
jgi:hypothetical protein